MKNNILDFIISFFTTSKCEDCEHVFDYRKAKLIFRHYCDECGDSEIYECPNCQETVDICD